MTMDIRLLHKEDDKFVEGGSGETRVQTRDEAFDEVSGSLYTNEVDPIFSNYVNVNLADVASGASGTYNYYIDMGNYKSISFQFYASADTGVGSAASASAWVEATNETGAVASACLYSDLTDDLFGTSVVSASGSGAGVIEVSGWGTGDPLICKYVKFKLSLAEVVGTDMWSWKIFYKKLY